MPQQGIGNHCRLRPHGERMSRAAASRQRASSAAAFSGLAMLRARYSRASDRIRGKRAAPANSFLTIRLIRGECDPARSAASVVRKKEPSVHSITSSASNCIEFGTSIPRTFAVLRLMTKSNLVGCSTGSSPGFAPRKILSTYSAARWYRAGLFAP